MLRFCDTDQPIIGEVYEQMNTMLRNIEEILATDPVVYDLINKVVVERWDKMSIPLLMFLFPSTTRILGFQNLLRVA